MENSAKKYTETFEVRVTKGRDGTDPEAPDWEVVEIKEGSAEVACDNLTRAEAQQMADMWTRKRDEAEAEE
jgi:hypothetical protein